MVTEHSLTNEWRDDQFKVVPSKNSFCSSIKVENIKKNTRRYGFIVIFLARTEAATTQCGTRAPTTDQYPLNNKYPTELGPPLPFCFVSHQLNNNYNQIEIPQSSDVRGGKIITSTKRCYQPWMDATDAE